MCKTCFADPYAAPDPDEDEDEDEDEARFSSKGDFSGGGTVVEKEAYVEPRHQFARDHHVNAFIGTLSVCPLSLCSPCNEQASLFAL